MAKTVESIGKYKVLSRLAQGGMGAVYTARHPTLERTVIIKKLTLRGNADIRERFRREAQIMMDLRNDAIVDVYDHFREGSSYYIVLEYVDGMSLDALIRQRRYLPNGIALLILREVCRALAYAHDKGVVHRDIKPANILISNEGEVKLVDFGIATIHGGEEQSDLTRDGMTLGTPSYMAPEQFRSTRSVDKRADIYSLGVVLYEMVTGKRPYPGSFTPEVIARIQRGRYTPPRRINPKVSPFVARLVARMLKARPDRRFSHLERVASRINRRYRIGANERSDETIRRYLTEEQAEALPQRRSRLAVAAGVAAALLLSLGVGLLFVRGYHRELFRPARYGALEVTARVLKADRDRDAIRLTGAVFVDDGEEIPEAPGGELTFRIVPEEETERFYVFRARRAQFTPGAYRVKVSNGSIVWWESFALPSLRERSATRLVIPGRRVDAYHVTAEFVERPRLPLEVDFTVVDRETGRLIGDGTRVSILIGDRWLAFTPALSFQLRSGEVHRFRFSHEGYATQVFSLMIQAEESRLVIEVGLDPQEE